MVPQTTLSPLVPASCSAHPLGLGCATLFFFASSCTGFCITWFPVFCGSRRPDGLLSPGQILFMNFTFTP